ncbi:unnamed protein product, partial [Cuscuta epithymum]
MFPNNRRQKLPRRIQFCIQRTKVSRRWEKKEEWRKKRREVAEGKKKIFLGNKKSCSSTMFYSKNNCNSCSVKHVCTHNSVLSPKLNVFKINDKPCSSSDYVNDCTGSFTSSDFDSDVNNVKWRRK